MNYEIIILSIIISIVFAELTGFTPAGIVVPGYFVLYISSPIRIIYTLIVAFIAFVLVKLLSKIMILYGRRIFGVTVIISIIINAVIVYLKIFPDNPQIIGGIIAGIIAREFDRQGIWQSLLSLGIVMGIVSTCAIIIN